MARTQIVQVPSENEAYNACPWANQVVETSAGFVCFEDPADGTEWLLEHDAFVGAIAMHDYNPLQLNAI